MVKIGHIDSTDYEFIKSKVPVLCVDLIIMKGDKVLLVKRNDYPGKHWWWTPGGRVYRNETLLEAVKRKAKEELGLDVIGAKQYGTYDLIFKDIHTTSVFYIVDVEGDIKLDRHHSAYKYTNIKSVISRLRGILSRLL